MPSRKTALPPDGGEPERLFSCAVIVTAVEIHVDPMTLDRVFTVHSEEHEPIMLRVAAVEMTSILARLALSAARALN